MDRRTFVKGATGALGSLALAPVRAQTETGAKRPPNVVLILPDEWRAQALGCMGNADVRTPHLDRLASEGVLLQNTLANTPVCCPARANILTGTYTSRNGMIANDLRLKEEVVTIADHFSHAGYRTGYVGKWHLDGGPRLPGFVPPGRRRHGFQFWAANECNHNYFHNWYFRDEDVPILTDEYEPVFWTNLAIEFIYESQDKPFFLMLSPGAPHDPYLAPEKYMKMYDPEKLTMRANWVEGTRGAGRKEIAAYYAAITAIDDQVGTLLETLRELHLEDNTIVLFSSDHGNMLGSQGKILKRKPWEESIRVPGIMRCPKLLPSGRKIDTLFSHVDFGPTLLSLCGLPVPEEMQGADLSRVVAGKAEKGPEAAYFQIFGPYHAGGVESAWRGIRTERHMYARRESGPWLLYDLENDPLEMHNLVGSPAAGSVLHELDKDLLDWMGRAGDSWSLDWTQPIEDGGRLYDYRTFYTVPEYLAWAREHPQLAPGIQ
ncbi:MAG TPA: sulfatase [Acidobacteriaceae bacterium]|nr:sulfatase [Acidobacteriaceae bacterium]